jgi:hypothetical protein
MNANNNIENTAEFADIEDALRLLAPRAPSAECVLKIAEALEPAANDIADADASDTADAVAGNAADAADASHRRANIIPFRRAAAWGVGLFATAACVAVAFVATRTPSPAPNGQPIAAAPIAATAPIAASAAALAAAPELPVPALASDEALVVAAAPDAPDTSDADTAPTVPIGPQVPASVEPLRLRRAPDGRFYQPYHVRYRGNAQPVRSNASRAVPVRTAAANEEIHFVRLDLI